MRLPCLKHSPALKGEEKLYFEGVSSPLQYKIIPLGDHAITIELSNVIDETINQKIIALFHQFKQKNLPFIKDIIPAYSSLTVVYDVMAIRKNNPSAYPFMKNEIENETANCDFNKTAPRRKIEIPVCYDVSMGIDLEEMSQQKNIPMDEIIKIHSGKIYHVFMTGFLPGFAYMGLVDEKIITPRKQHPRIKVLAGSVGIAGEQTGIYPFDSPADGILSGKHL